MPLLEDLCNLLDEDEKTKILKISEILKKYINQDFLNLEEYQNLAPIFNKLYTNKGIIEKVENSVIDEYTLDDKASKQLQNIRKKLQHNNKTKKYDSKQKIHSDHKQPKSKKL